MTLKPTRPLLLRFATVLALLTWAYASARVIAS
jgi:hypothetical protein